MYDHQARLFEPDDNERDCLLACGFLISRIANCSSLSEMEAFRNIYKPVIERLPNELVLELREAYAARKGEVR